MSNINDLCAKCHRGRWRHTNPRLPGCHVFIEPGPQPAPTLSTFNQVLAALRNPSVDLGDLDVCKACLSVESPYLHSVGTACPTGPTVAAPRPAPSGDEAKVREIVSEDDVLFKIAKEWTSGDYGRMVSAVREAYAAGKADGAREAFKECEGIARMLPQTPRVNVARAIADAISRRKEGFK